MNSSQHMKSLVHVSSSESREIHAFFLNMETGHLDLIEVIKVPGDGAPTRGNIPLTWGKNHQQLYAQVRIDPYPLSVYNLDIRSGRLSLAQTVNTHYPLAYLSCTNDGSLLMGASYDSAVVTVNKIELNGNIQTDRMQVINTLPKAHCIVESPSGGYVYATAVDGDAIHIYRINSGNGLLDFVDTFKTRIGVGPRHLAFHKTNNTLYCINEHTGSIAVYEINKNSGSLIEIQYLELMPDDFVGRAMGADIHVTPDGVFLYACIRKTNSIYIFRIDPINGLLTTLGSMVVENYPRGFSIDPYGRFILCAGQKSNRLSVYKICKNSGELSLVDQHEVGKMPSWVEIIKI